MSLLRDHLGSGPQWTEDRSAATPARFGEAASEANLLAEKAGLLDLSHGGVVALTGPERTAFLGGLTTNQINDVADDRVVYSAMLSPQGRFLWDFTIVARDDALLLVTEPDRVDALVERLTLYKLRSKVEIENASAAFGLLGVAGPGADAAMGSLFAEVSTIGDAGAAPGTAWSLADGSKIWRDPRHADFGWRLLVGAADLPALWDRLAAAIAPVGFEAWEGYRIARGLPRGGAELQPETTLPLEAGFLELNGVSFTKGCYVGQETTARTHHRGTLKKRLHLVKLPTGAQAAPGTPVLTADGKEAGVITSLAPSAPGQAGQAPSAQLSGLAILRRSDVTEGKPLTAAGQPVTVAKPSWAAWE